MTATRKPAVLVVDDEALDRRLLATALERDGYRSVEAAGADDACAHLAAERFALMVCDLDMPGVSGVSLARHVREAHPDTGILIVSGKYDRETADELIVLGAYGYLIKPFGIDQFLITVANALRRRESERNHALAERALSKAVTSRTAELRQSRLETVRRLAAAVESRDGDTGLHSDRTGRYSRLIAERLGLEDALCERIGIAAPLHDVGKIAIPDRILHKAAPLTPEERETIQTHAAVGHSMLTGSGEELLELAATIAWTHHERLDGSGYPRGLAGEAIPLVGRIVAVADTLDALTSDRPYRTAFKLERSLEILQSLAGSKLDPRMVAALARRSTSPRHE
jgi:putative two-component system response regulator